MSISRIVLFGIAGLIYAANICSASAESVDTNAAEVSTDIATVASPENVAANNEKAGDLGDVVSNTKISGSIGLIEGQIVKGYGTSGVSQFEHAWIQQGSGLLRLETRFNEHTRMVVEGGADILFSYTIPIALWDKEFAQDQKVAKFNFWLKQAKGVYNFGGLDAETFPLQIELGEFEYKYNPDVRNLGEYLFRASAYPVAFLNWFDGAFYRMVGLKATTAPVEWFNFDALLFSELYQVPLQDFSLAGVATFKIGKVGQFGVGIDLNRLFSIDGRYTTPTIGAGGKINDNIYSQEVDSAGTAIPGTQKYYTFRSEKVALRGSFDIKGFFDWPILGTEDLKLYGEAAILGLKNYPTQNPGRPETYYANMSERCPVMVGFNFPGFKIIDVLSLELEYFKSPFLPSYINAFKYGIPVPDVSTSNFVSIQDTKWSVYLKKRLGAFMIVAQAARDHYQPLNNNVGFTELGDVMAEGKDWWWAMKLQFGY